MWEGGFWEVAVTLRFLLVENCSRDHRMKSNIGNKTPPFLTGLGQIFGAYLSPENHSYDLNNISLSLFF